MNLVCVDDRIFNLTLLAYAAYLPAGTNTSSRLQMTFSEAETAPRVLRGAQADGVWAHLQLTAIWIFTTPPAEKEPSK